MTRFAVTTGAVALAALIASRAISVLDRSHYNA
jgi:hypothetical protein